MMQDAHPGMSRLPSAWRGPGAAGARLSRGLGYVAAAAAAAGAVAGTAAAQSADGSPWADGNTGGGWLCGFGGAPLTGYDLLLLVGVAVAVAVMGFAGYRLMLEDLVRRGIAPARLKNTVINLAIGTWLLAGFALIPDVVGLCWFAILGALFLIWLIALMIKKRILVGVAVGFILLAVAIVAILQLSVT